GSARAPRLRGARPAPLDAAQGAAGPRRRGTAHGGHHRAGAAVRPLRLPQGGGAAAVHGGLGRERQAGGADLAARRAEGAAAPAQARADVAGRRLLRPAQARAAEPRMVLRLRRGPHPRRAQVQDAQRHRRVHPRVPGDPGGAQAEGGGRHRPPVRPVHPARRARAHPVRQRARVREQGGAEVDRGGRRQDRLHRAGQSVGERLRGELQRPPARRAVERRDLLQPARGPGRHRELAAALQRRTPARLARLQAARTRGVRASLRRAVVRVTPTLGVRANATL
ncbi:MAG: Integrase, partial [uncultured Nocardioidaceae bacterium]